jgi:TolB protein
LDLATVHKRDSHMVQHHHLRVFMTAVALTAGGCDPDGSVVSPGRRVGPELTASSAFPGLVTDPAPSSTAGTSPGLAASTEPDVIFVSAPPGVVLVGTSATIVNHRTNRSVSTPLIDRGFDPVPIGARAADTILVTFDLPDGGTRQTWAIVPRTRRPAVVRIDPRSAERDVPLTARMVIVFSEPIDAASVSTSMITLKRNGEVIAGVAEVVPQDPLLARFTPAAELANEATYELAVADQVRDLDGERLESAARVSFTTAAVNARPAAGRLAFSSWNGSASMIHTMKPDGSALAAVAEGNDPSFSPDGKRIAFWRYEGGAGGVYIANADGSNVTRVVSEGHQPAWSPDGGKLAYGCGGICLINVDGTGLTRLTPAAPTSQTPGVCVRDTDPAWSPNGSTIAFTRWPDARIPTSMCLPLGVAGSFPFDFWTEVWLIESDGSNLRPLRDRDGLIATYAGWPSWSPDGKHLAFYHTNGSEERIDVARADGTGIVTVVQQGPPRWENVLGSPDWSPDGSRIVFSTRGGWGFADATGSGGAELVTSPGGVVPYSLTWSWSRR